MYYWNFFSSGPANGEHSARGYLLREFRGGIRLWWEHREPKSDSICHEVAQTNFANKGNR